MSLDQLDTPLRMTWTLGQDEVSGEEIMLLADRIAVSRLFYLTLQGNFSAFSRLPELLDRLVAAGIQISLVVDPGAEFDHLSVDLPIQQFLVDCTASVGPGALDPDRLDGVIDRLVQLGIKPALQLVPLQDNLSLLPELFDFSVRKNIERVVLPNVPLVDDYAGRFAARLLHDHDITEFKQLWEGRQVRPMPKELVVHDLFLWEILCPEQDREHYSGCQAGNSLSHLDRSGFLYPCSAWAQPLGSLLEETVQALWQKPNRKSVLEHIGSTPAGCIDCKSWDHCYGGCRGLSKELSQHNCGRDLMCSDKR